MWAQTDVTSTYLTNAGFETSPTFDGTSLGSNASSKSNATPTDGSALLSGAKNVYQISGWTLMTTETSDFARTFTMPYNTTLYVNSNGSTAGQAVTAPANGSSVTEGNDNVLFVEANWCNQALLGVKQTVNLPAGKYTLTFDTYVTTNLNYGTSRCGVSYGSTTNYKWPTALNTWTNNEITFTLADATDVTISMGYLKNSNQGGGNSPFLFVDNVKLTYTAIVVKDVLETALTAATNANTTLKNSDLTAAIATAQSVYENEDATQEQVNNAAATLNTAVELAMSAVGDVTLVFLDNPGFENCIAETSDVAAKTIKDYSSVGWTKVNSGDFTTIAVTAYGGGKKVGGSTTPSTKKDGTTVSGNTLGIIAGWGDNVTIQSGEITWPAGVYTFTVDHYLTSSTSNYGNNSSKFGLVTSSNSYLVSSTTFSASTWTTETVTFTLTESTTGKIQIGLTGLNASGSGSPAVFYDDITITYQSFLAGAKSAWDEAKAELVALDKTALPDKAEAAITDALGAAEPTTVEDYNSATAVLQALIDSYDGIKSAYDKVLALIVLATAEKDNSTADDKTALATAINTATTDIETRTTADDLTSDYNTLETARQTYVTSGAQPTADHVFDLTFKIADAAVTGTGWSASGTASGQQYTDAPDNRYFDCGWNSSLNKSQKVESLPAGYYTMKAATRAETSDITAANIYVNQDRSELNSSTDNHHDGSTGGELGNGWSWTEVDFELRAAGNVTVGFYAQTTGHGWAGADDYHLYYKGIAVDDEKADALKATIVEGKMNSTVADNQTSALSTFESAQTIENYDALETAIAAANASKEAYTEANAKLIAMKAVVDATNVYTEAALNEYYTTPKSKYDDNSLTDDEANALQDPAETTGVRAAITVDNFLLSAWNTEPDFTPEDSPYYINSWSTEGKTDGSNMTTPFFEYWVSNSSTAKLDERTLTATLSDVPAGNYHVDVLVRVLKNTGDDPTPYGITLDVNGGTPVDVCAGNQIQIGSTTYYYDTFRAFGTVADDGVLTINFNVAEDNNISWLAFKNVTYAEFAGATEEQKTALASAITIAEGKKLGFEKNEYAPYNNVDVLEKLVLAKAIDPETATALEVTTATSNLSGATWTANSGDVDAIYNGTFAETGTGSNPKGWTRSNNGWGQQITGLTAEINGVAEGTTTAWYYNNNGSWQYGNDGVYTMPLASNQAYELTFKYSKHGNDWQSWMKASVVNSENEGLEVAQFSPADNSTNYVTAKAYFTTGAAGNYILSIEQNGNAHLTDVSLVKVASTTKNISEEATAVASENQTYYETASLTRTLSASYWNTFSVPFDMSIPDGWTVKEFDSVDDVDENVINFKDATTIKAGEPYLVKPNIDVVDPIYNNKIVENTAGNIKGEGDYKFAAQIYNKSLATDGTIAYLATDGKIKKLTSASGLKGLRAYFIIPDGSTEARIAFIDDETTGISRIENSELRIENSVYNLQGQRVNKAQKGLYIKNGKKVIVK